MSPEKLTETPQSADQLLDQLGALDKNSPDYEQTRNAINEQLQKIADDPKKTIETLNLQAEAKLSAVDKYQADKKRQALDDQNAVNQLLDEIKAEPTTTSSNIEKPVDSSQNDLYIGEYLNKLNSTAESVKKAIRSFNWRSLKQLSKAEKESLCEQIDNIVSNASYNLADAQANNIDDLSISRLTNDARYQIQKLADDRHIKIPFEY